MAGLHFSSGIDKGFENDLNKMNQQMNSFSSNVSKQSGIINDSFKEIGLTLTSILSIGALAKAGKEVITFSADLQTSLTEVSTVSEEVTNNFDKYKQALLDLSTQSGSSAIQLSNAFYDIVSAGIDGAEGLELLAVAEKASTAGFVEVGTAADGMTTVINAWGLATSDAGKISDIFFKTVEKGKTTFPELGANIAKVAPLAASMGISFEETAAAIASVTKQGTRTPEALTQIRAAMVAMNEVLGDGWSNAMTFQEGLQAIADKAGGSQNKLKELLGTDEAVLAVLALTGKNAQGAASDLDAMNNSLGATSAAFEKVSNTASQQGKILVNNLLAAFEPLGTAVVETFASLAKSLNDAFDSGDIKTYAEVLGTLIAAFAAWKISIFAVNQAQKINTILTELNTAAQKASAISGKTVTAGNYLMAKSFKSMTAAFASNPIGLLVTGLTLAIPLIVKFVDSQSELSKETAKLTSEIQKEQTEANNLFEALKKTNPQSEERTAIIQKLNEKYPDLLKNYNLDVAGLNEIESAQTAVNQKIVETIALRSQEERIQGAAKKLYDKQSDILNLYLSALDGVADKGTLAVTFSKINTELQKEGANSVDIAQKIAKDLGIEIAKGSYVTHYGAGQAYRSSKYEKLLRIVGLLTDASKDFLMTQKEIEDFTKAFLGGESGSAQSSALSAQEQANAAALKAAADKAAADKKAAEDKAAADKLQREKALAALEIWNQSQINELTKSYGGQESLEKEFSNRMLKQRLDYLTKLQELTTDKLEKLKIEEERINLAFELAGDGKSKLEQLDLNYKKELLLLKAKYKKEEEFNKQALEAEKKYLEEKLKLTVEDSDKLEIQNKLDTVNTAIDESIKAEEFGQRKRIEVIKEAQAKILELEKQLQEDITIAQTQQLQSQIAEQKEIINSAGGADSNKETNVGKDVRNAANYFSNALADAGDEFSKTIGSVVSDLGAAINITSNQDSSTFEKAQGWFQLAYSSAKKLYSIKDNIAEKDILSQRKLTDSLSDQISMEMRINEIRQERAENDLKSNVFLEPSYIDQATNAVQKQQAAYKSLNDSISALASNAIFTGEGTASRRLFGSKTTSADFSIEQILGDYISAFSGYGVADLFGPGIGQALEGGSIIDVLSDAIIDPAGLFGGYAKGKATENALNSIRDTFTSALTAMGKTSSDITSLTSEEWLDLFTLLDEAGNIQDEATKQLLENAQESLQAYEDAMAELESVISDVAGSLGDSLGDSIVNAIANGTDALDEFSKSFDDVLIEMAKSTANQIFFQDLFDTLQTEMKASVTGGDNQWQDDLLRFYDQLPTAIDGAQGFLTDFDSQLKELGFEGITGSGTTGGASATTSISESITEQTGTEIKGRINAIMMSNQVIADNSNDMLSYAIQNLVTLNKIKENTDYLPMIAKYTKQTADKL